MNCPFYGRALYGRVVPPIKFLLLDTEGNQCAIVTDHHAPCYMETDGKVPDWKDCYLVREMRMEADD